MRARMEAHLAQRRGERLRSVRIVCDVEDRRRSPRQDLKPRRNVDGQQTLPHRLLRDGQAFSQCFQCSQRSRRIQQLIRAA